VAIGFGAPLSLLELLLLPGPLFVLDVFGGLDRKVSGHDGEKNSGTEFAYLLPGPNWSEGVKEANIFKQVGVEPQSRWDRKHGDDEQDQADNCHCEEQANEAQTGHAEVPHSLPDHEGPEREQDDSNDAKECTHGIQFLLPLCALVQPDIVIVVASLLMLLNADSPETLDTLGFRVVVAFVAVRGIYFGDSER